MLEIAKETLSGQKSLVFMPLLARRARLTQKKRSCLLVRTSACQRIASVRELWASLSRGSEQEALIHDILDRSLCASKKKRCLRRLHNLIVVRLRALNTPDGHLVGCRHEIAEINLLIRAKQSLETNQAVRQEGASATSQNSLLHIHLHGNV